jgi:hypothetical protein
VRTGKETADLYAPVEKHFQERSAKLQIPPLRYAPVGMTKGRVALPFKSDAAEDEQQVPVRLRSGQALRFATLRSGRRRGGRRFHSNLMLRRINSRSLHFATPDFLWNLVALLYFLRPSLRKGAHVALPVLRGRKSGFAPVGMTLVSGTDKERVEAVFIPLMGRDAEGLIRNRLPPHSSRMKPAHWARKVAGRKLVVSHPGVLLQVDFQFRKSDRWESIARFIFVVFWGRIIP